MADPIRFGCSDCGFAITVEGKGTLLYDMRCNCGGVFASPELFQLDARLDFADDLLREARQHINDPLTVGKSYLLERINEHLEET